MVDSLFIVVSLFCGGLRFLCSTKCRIWFCNHRAGEKRAGCFTLIVF